MGKIQWDSELKAEGEEVEKRIGKLIKGKDEEKAIEEFDVREAVMEKVCKDYKDGRLRKSKNRNSFVDSYQDKQNNNIVAIIALGKKASYYFDYDYDASDWSTYIYCRTVFKDKKTTIYKQSESKYCRVICIDKHWFRGDTMNSWKTTLIEFFRLFGGGEDGYLKNLEINKKRGKNHGKWCIPEDNPANDWLEFLINPENYNDKRTLPSYITEFMKVVYTIGNFVPVPPKEKPYNFNLGRNSSVKDYWDLTLKKIYNYYVPDKHDPNKADSDKADSETPKWLNEDWLKEFGDGQAGWDDFVEKNYMQPFVNKIENVQGAKYGMPYELWDGHFNSNEKLLPKEEWQYEQFFVNAKVRILERGKLIAEDLLNGAEDLLNGLKES